MPVGVPANERIIIKLSVTHQSRPAISVGRGHPTSPHSYLQTASLSDWKLGWNYLGQKFKVLCVMTLLGMNLDSNILHSMFKYLSRKKDHFKT